MPTTRGGQWFGKVRRLRRCPSALEHGECPEPLASAAEELGPIEVLRYSPVPRREFLSPVLETTLEGLAAAVEFSILGPFAAVQQIFPGMRGLGRGSILLVNGC